MKQWKVKLRIILQFYYSASFAKTLPRLDSNQDKENQNLLCYRYTTG